MNILEKIDRVQLSRKKGMKLPKNTLIVDRRSEFGNWIKVDKQALHSYHCAFPTQGKLFQYYVTSNLEAVNEFRKWLCKPEQKPLRAKFLRTIKIRQIEHLACWCKLDEPCHCDVWLQYLRGELVVDDRPALTEEAIQVLEQVFPAVKE
jgi:hypothetical protein